MSDSYCKNCRDNKGYMVDGEWVDCPVCKRPANNTEEAKLLPSFQSENQRVLYQSFRAIGYEFLATGS